MGHQEHQRLPTAVDAALAQLLRQLRAGQLSPAGQCLQDGVHGLVDRAIVETVPGAQPLPHPDRADQ
jgi:hypothetical protein